MWRQQLARAFSYVLLKSRTRKVARIVAAALAALCALAVIGCDRAEHDRPPGRIVPRTTSDGVRLVSGSVSAKTLEAKAVRGAASVTLRLETGAPITYRAWWRGTWWREDADIDPPRRCSLRLSDRKGEALMIDGTTLGVTPTRSIEQFEEDLRVAEGLSQLLERDQRAWKLYRWEIRDLERTAHDLQGVRAPP